MTSPNAPLLMRMNKLKQAASEDLLTDVQRESVAAIQEYRKDQERYINLYGPRNSGKTFLCWVFQEKGAWEYHPSVPDSVSHPAVIYDHGSPDRMATRRLRNNVAINGIACVVYVTEKPAAELYPRVELVPTETHYETIASNWSKLSLDPAEAPTG